MHHEKLVTHAESHVNAASLLKSREQRYIKAINNKNLWVWAHPWHRSEYNEMPVCSYTSVVWHICFKMTYSDGYGHGLIWPSCKVLGTQENDISLILLLLLQVIVYEHCFVILLLTTNKTWNCLTPLPILTQDHSGGDSVALGNTPPPPPPPPLILRTTQY